MSVRREAALKMLGLWPRWRLRREARERLRRQGSEPPDRRLGTEAALAAAGVSPVAGAVARREESRRRPAEPDMFAATATASTGGADRRSLILGMDWPELKACVAHCTDCKLAKTRTQTVFGVGDESADWLFVGEGPGAEEDARGEPFVGQAGRLLDNMLAAIKLKRGENVYIANVVKCRPPGNRNPEAEEMERCEPYLERQIELIRPRLIVALGRVAAQSLLKTNATIANLRCKVHRYRGTPLIVTYHPAYLLRNLPDKAKAWEDLVFAVETMKRLTA
ncbi:uracil-DNA glycosylase [Pelomicrobium methylotrophicum]|nr:uracil-DNA glycosylase [Pelomicrobium methylotrophicum]